MVMIVVQLYTFNLFTSFTFILMFYLSGPFLRPQSDIVFEQFKLKVFFLNFLSDSDTDSDK